MRDRPPRETGIGERGSIRPASRPHAPSRVSRLTPREGIPCRRHASHACGCRKKVFPNLCLTKAWWHSAHRRVLSSAPRDRQQPNQEQNAANPSFTQRGRGGIYIWICTLSSYPDSKLSGELRASSSRSPATRGVPGDHSDQDQTAGRRSLLPDGSGSPSAPAAA